METATTYGIRVTVEAFYQPSYSKPLEHEYVHAYRVTIENTSRHTVQLMRRHWHIWDSNGTWREVQGEGVVGLQPILEPNQTHEYVSGCPLQTDMGKMYGHFLMKRQHDGREFEVQIPLLQLIVPFKNN